MYNFQFRIHPAELLAPAQNLMQLTISLVGGAHENSFPVIKPILENQHQLDWFLENENSIRNFEFPYEIGNNHSIAESINLFYENVDPDNFDELETIYNYKLNHGFRFAFRGQDIPDVFIGKNKNKYELSREEKEIKFAHEIIIDSLFKEAEKARRIYLGAHTG